MPKKTAKRALRQTPPKHDFSQKLLLNQWIISLFGIDPLEKHTIDGRDVRPFHKLAEPIVDPRLEGLNEDGVHQFYNVLVESGRFWNDSSALSREQLRIYEKNIVEHTQRINRHRDRHRGRPITWKYFQWLTLLFVEIYLDRFFTNPEKLLDDLNAYVRRFNEHYQDHENIKEYKRDDLNKICFQSATGSGKTLLMHVNLLQYLDHARKNGRENDLSRTILLTPNESLSDQHEIEFEQCGFTCANYARGNESVFSWNRGRFHVDVLEITKLSDQKKLAEQKDSKSIAAESLGDRNLLLVDEGHRGAKTEEGAWFTRRSKLCAKGFTLEYSATFSQAVSGTKNEDDYAKSILFDYSYKWFYEDGFGKDYIILNISEGVRQADGNNRDDPESLANYLTACLLKYYQQLRIYEENRLALLDFNIEKPLWVFVGSSVVAPKDNTEKKIEKQYASDVTKILRFFAAFLSRPEDSIRRIGNVLDGNTDATGLLDAGGNDLFREGFPCLRRLADESRSGNPAWNIYSDILERLFHNRAGGTLTLERIRGDSGEIAIRSGDVEVPFGLINVGDAKGLCDHAEEIAIRENLPLIVRDGRFSEPMFGSVKDSRSPVHLLIGSKKFVEGWDCWRVSTMGLMHVGQTEGAQIIQLFGRGIRLKGYHWSLKRSVYAHPTGRPRDIDEIETLHVFGIGSDFMDKFRKYLKEEGLPVHKKPEEHRIPLNVTFDFGKKLQILRPKRKTSDGKEYSFENDAPVPTLDPSCNRDDFERAYDRLCLHKVVSDWHPRIQRIESREAARDEQGRREVKLGKEHIDLLDIDALYFELEHFKRGQNWYKLNITKSGIVALLERTDWYTLYLPKANLEPTTFSQVRFLQRVAAELLKRFCDKYYNYRKREFIEPRLELRDLTPDDPNIPKEDHYRLIVDGSEEQVIADIKAVRKDVSERKKKKTTRPNLSSYCFDGHLYRPLLHLKPGGRVTIQPVSLNDSEFGFVEKLGEWCEDNADRLKKNRMELFLLRNLSRGKGVGFFEAGRFYPDFILWILADSMQYVNFVDPHGLMHEGSGSEKILFHERIKELQRRLGDPKIVLNSFILSPTEYSGLRKKWKETREELERKNILFMADDKMYMDKLVAKASNELNEQE